jgi:thymidylate kinase
MSNSARRKEREAEFEKEQDARRVEEARKDALTMWERIEEADANDDMKDILHRLASHIGLEQ